MARSRATGEEWTGGIAVLEGAGARGNDVSVLVWVDASGALVGSFASHADHVLTRAAESLKSTIAAPLDGNPRTPARIRVATTELADALDDLGTAIEIVRAATPEVDTVAKLLRAELGRRRAPTYVPPGVEPSMIAGMFAALAELYRAAPWTFVPAGHEDFSLGMWALGIEDGVVVVIGQQGDGFGLILFEERAAHRTFLAQGGVAPGKLGAPKHIAVHFERGADIRAELRREISQHGWEVAGPHAYPQITVSDENSEQRPYTAREVLWIEGTARALGSFGPQHRESLAHAWATGEAWKTQRVVSTFDGLFDVDFRVDAVPQKRAPAANGPTKKAAARKPTPRRKR